MAERESIICDSIIERVGIIKGVVIEGVDVIGRVAIFPEPRL